MDSKRHELTEVLIGSRVIIGNVDPLAADRSLPYAVILVPLSRYPVLRHVRRVVAKPRGAPAGMNPSTGGEQS